MKIVWSKLLVVLAVLLALVMIPATTTAVSYTNTLTLENKTGNPDWYVVEDEYSATLQYNDSGVTFDFYLSGKVPAVSTSYSLIYYADPYVGNGTLYDSGALLGVGTSDAEGNIVITDTLNLGHNLPFASDTNITEDYLAKLCNGHLCNPTATMNHGAKVWLVLSDDYDVVIRGLKGWYVENVPSYLFETDLITYQYLPSGDVGLTTTVLPASMGMNISPLTLAFGSVAQGACSTPAKEILLTNTGSVAISVSAIVSAGFYTDCLELSNDGSTWVDAHLWSYSPIAVSGSKTVYARVCVPVGYTTGTYTGSVSFVASVAP